MLMIVSDRKIGKIKLSIHPKSVKKTIKKPITVRDACTRFCPKRIEK